jgi:hypothetical protein
MGIWTGPQTTTQFVTHPDKWTVGGAGRAFLDPAKLGIFGNMFGDTGDPDPYGGMPNGGAYPTYIGMDPNSLSAAPGGNNMAMDKFTQESMRNGVSPGTQFALQENTLAANRGRDDARKMAGGMAKDATASLAMHNGLGGGQGERINKYAMNVGMDNAQKADAAAAGNRANLLVADESQRSGDLKSAAGMGQQQEMNNYNMKAGDLDRMQKELALRNQYQMGGYQAQMGAWAAGKQANATQSSGKK